MEKKVTIYTQVYNTKQYVDQCIRSVLSQTYTNFEYILVDNGCTDGSSDIIDHYAELDSRIVPIKFEENQYGPRIAIIKKYSTGIYQTVLDSDDWWEPDYLERLIRFMEKNELDLSVTGTIQHFEESHMDKTLRMLEQPLILSQKQFAQNYPFIWTFPSTSWGNIMKREIFLATDNESVFREKYPYGGDTMVMLRYIMNCRAIGIDNSALYHYRIHKSGKTFRYSSRRFDANIACYEQIKEFLELHQTFDPPKQEWLKQVHLTSMTVTLGLLRDARITDDEKLAECVRIIGHPLTVVALSNDCNEREQWFSVMWEIVSSVLTEGKRSDSEELHSVLRLLSPQCCGVVQAGNLGLFTREPGLLDALRKDDWDQMVCRLMELIVRKRYARQYDLGQMLGSLIPAKTPLEGMTDTRFFREYSDICMLVLSENYSAALEQMTGLLLEGKKLYAAEQFLELYLSLSALENQAPAFLFGKMQLAWLYLKQGKQEECQALADELAEMGVDSEELSELRRALEERP